VGAASRNRTGDLRITRRMRAIQGRPGSHIDPAGAAHRSAVVRPRPGLLLADPLARSTQPLLRFWNVATLRRVGPPGPHARRVRGRRCYSGSESDQGPRARTGTDMRSRSVHDCPGLFVPKPSRGVAASAAVSLTWKRPSVSVRWCAPLVVAIVTHLVTRLRAGSDLALQDPLQSSSRCS
jgi:hypothetical protein